MNNSTLDGRRRRLRTILNTEFAQDAFDVILDSMFGDSESVRNLLVTVSMHDERKHFEFAPAEGGGKRGGLERHRDLCGKISPAPVHGVNGLNQLVVQHVLS